MSSPRSIDLHSLQCFDFLIRERSVSRAAERMNLSQSAMSDMLARLRERFGDPLLVRARVGMQPTPRADALLPQVRLALDQLLRLSEGSPEFEPASCHLRFRITTSDYTQFLLMPALVETLSTLAPHAAVDVLPVSVQRVEAALETGEIDIAVAYLAAPPQSLRRIPLFDEQYSLVARRDHPKVHRDMSAQEYASLQHIAVAPSGLSLFSAPVDDALQSLGLTRTISVTSPHFLLAAYLVSLSDLVLAIPSRAAAKLSQLYPIRNLPLPIATQPLHLSLFWHERTHHSVAHQWFRETIKEALSPHARP
jgi:DNA-binding transcriptional LysR family regulator